MQSPESLMQARFDDGKLVSKRLSAAQISAAGGGLDDKGLAAQRVASAPQRFQSLLVVRGILYQELKRVDLIYEFPFRQQRAPVLLAIDVEPVEGRVHKFISYFGAIG